MKNTPVKWGEMKQRMMLLSIDQLQKTAHTEGIDVDGCTDKARVVDAIIYSRKANADKQDETRTWRRSNAIAFKDTERPLPPGWEDQWDEMRKELSKLSVRELKALARSEGISLGYSATRKDSTISCIVTNRRNRALEEYRGAVGR